MPRLVLLAFWVLLAALTTKAAEPIRVMVVTGGHAYDTAFGSLFEGYSGISAKVYPRDIAFVWDIRMNWDVLVLYDLTSEINEKDRANLMAFVESGKGIVVLHHALADYNQWEWWWKDVVGGSYVLKQEGDRLPTTYLQNQEVEIEAANDHPITAGIGKFKLTDEVFKQLWRSPKVRPILTTNHPASDPVLGWISAYEKSRVVVIQSGHDRKSYTNETYRRLIRNSIFWAASRQEQ